MEIRRRPPNPPINVNNWRYQVALPESEPRNILEKIVWHKEMEVQRRRTRLPLLDLRKQVQASDPARDFLGALWQRKREPALIAEIKKASPSKGVIREDFDPVAIAQAYQTAGASCLCVFTEEQFFLGSFETLASVRKEVALPILCKEFVIYPYQIYLARLHGADAILLIAAILNDRDLRYFLKIANSLGMTPLIEVHTLSEVDRVLNLEGVSLIGINNRNWEDFSVDLQTTRQLLEWRGETLQERGIQVVSESGFYAPDDLNVVKQAGGNAVLIGESLLVQSDPAEAIASLFSN